MTRLDGSVGQGGDNRAADVRLVQQLLNRFDLAPLAPLAEDGRAGRATLAAVRHFQVRYVELRSPDGRVDPGGRTFHRLTAGTERRGQGKNAEIRRSDRTLRAERVDPRVQETALTTRIIDDLVPRFGTVRAKIIGGYLSDADQFWKVNYHWEYLLQMVDHSLSLPLEAPHRKALQTIRSNLLSCPPDPATGYTTSPLGRPEDRSGAPATEKRHQVLRNAKDSFRKVVGQARVAEKSTRGRRMFDLAAAPVAAPGRSKHGSGYAVDILGDNPAIKALCKGLGATLVFDEKSHVHVEFRNGVSR